MKNLLEMTIAEVAVHIVEELRKLSLEPVCGFDKSELMYLYYPNTNHNTMLVAHIDTVDKTPPTDVKQAGQVLYVDPAKKLVLGADDRAGVFAILEILKSRYIEGKSLPTVLFTNLEESGGVGGGYFCQQNHNLDHIDLMVELDRQGKDDWVSYQINDKEVDTYIESFGFHESFGCYSDIADLSSEFDIPSVNISIGYERQHTSKETLNIDWMNGTIKKVHNILDNPIDKRYGCQEGFTMYSGWWKPTSKVVPINDDWEWSDANAADVVISANTMNQNCWYCQRSYWHCNCGTMADVLERELTISQMNYVMGSLLQEGDMLLEELLMERGVQYAV